MPVRLSIKQLFFVAMAGLLLGLIGSTLTSAFTPLARAQSTEALRSQIEVANAEITRLQNEILTLQSQLTTTAAEKASLQKAVAELNLGIKKLQSEITLTQAKIKQKDAAIQLLAGTIATTSSAVERERQSAAQSIRILNAHDRQPLVLMLLAGSTLSSFFDTAVAMADLQIALQKHIRELSQLKNNLQNTKSTTESARAALASLTAELGSQQKGLLGARSTQNQLLTATKNKEANYQALIAKKKKEQAQFQEALSRYEVQLKGVGAGQVPSPGPLLAWPLRNINVTQYFGNTPFASANPQVYNGSGHTGIDLAASPGTPILSSDDGVVVATGNTDEVCPYASFGKWIFIKHPTGLGTLYAHLSTFSVSSGQSVSRGAVIGHSGTTGYATGPHLHYGVYVASAVVIQRLPTAVRCPFLIPIAPRSAYLNPMSYLPAR